MESKNLVPCIVVSLFVLAACNIESDREKCANDLVGLATCLPYVSGGSKSPPSDCCSGLKTVMQKSPQCICLLVKDRNDPSLGLKINATRALGLPSQCHVPANISACPGLLHLAPHSADAKVFEDFENGAKKGNASGTDSSSGGEASTATAGDERSHGGKAKRWLEVEMVTLVLVVVATVMVVHNSYII